MIQIIRKTFKERINMYMECDKEQIINMLCTCDKYINHFNTPRILVKSREEYEKMEKIDLCILKAKRELFESPDCCKECE